MAVAVAACRTGAGSSGTLVRLPVAASDIARRGPDLNAIIGHNGTWHAHLMTTGSAGLDFNTRKDTRVYPVAAGVVTSVGTMDSAGRYVEVYHGLYRSLYAHLDRPLVERDQPVERGTQIAVAGATGAGARSGPHLHLGFWTPIILRGVIPAKSDVFQTVAFFDAADFSAFPARDAHGQTTLPYWNGAGVDGELDRAWTAHYAALQRFANATLPRVASEAEMAELMKRTSAHVRRGVDPVHLPKKLALLDERLTEVPLRQEMATLLRHGPLLTAPLRDPAPTHDALYARQPPRI